MLLKVKYKDYVISEIIHHIHENRYVQLWRWLCHAVAHSQRDCRKNQWLSNAEFTDIVAISQSTPGPIGINCATYVGYTSTLHAGYPEWAAILGAILASLSIMWLPFVIMILISHYLMTHKDSKIVKDIFAGLRPAIIGLIAAAALLLMNKDNFGSPQDNPNVFGISIAIFVLAFYLTAFKKANPILLMLTFGCLGLIIY